MNNWKKLLLLSAVSAVLAACSGDDGKNGTDGTNGTNGANGSNGMDGTNGSDGLNSLVAQTQLDVGDANCEFGGVQIDSGIDTDGNGTLAAGEVTDTEYVCALGLGNFELQLLHFADVDGGRDILNNVVRFSAILNKFRGEVANTVVLSSGDNWIPGPEYNVAGDAALTSLGIPAAGRAHVAYLNALEVQASVFGNHEFDLGTEAIAGVLNSETTEGGTWPGAQFPYLSANLDFSADEHLAPLVGENGAPYTALANSIAASTVINVGGQRIGVVGATTPNLNSISSPGDDIVITPATTVVADLAAVIQPAVDALTNEGINKIILLSHMQQIVIERELATLLKDVDIIIAGGSNTLLADTNDRLSDGDTAADMYPLSFSSATNEPTLVVNTDGDYSYLGRLVVNFDANGIIVPELLDDTVNGVYAADEAGLVENSLATTDAIAEVNTISGQLTDALTTRAGHVFGLTSVYLNGERGSVRTEETNFGNLTAQANLEYAQETDETVAISVKNAGGIRDSVGFCSVPAGATGDDALVCSAPAGIPGINNAGEISQLDLEIALRFNNSLNLITLTGAQLIQILEHGVSNVENTAGRFPQVAGIRFSYDADGVAQTVDLTGPQPVVATAGTRVKDIVILDSNGAADGGAEVRLMTNGVVDAAAAAQSFRVVTLGFIAGGGDDYPFPVDMAANVVDLEEEGVQSGDMTFADNGTEQDALAEYLNSNFPADADDTTPSFSDADTVVAEDNVIVNLKEGGTF